MSSECYHRVLEVAPSVAGIAPCSGVGMDFGGSLIKVVYVTLEDSKLLLHFVAYRIDDARATLEEIFGKLSSHLRPGQELITTGLGCNQYRKIIQEVFNVRVKNLMEAGLNADAVVYFTRNVALPDYVFPRESQRAKPFIEAKIEAMQMVKQAMQSQVEGAKGFKLMRSVSQEILSLFSDVSAAPQTDQHGNNVTFPVFLCCLGSGLFYMTVFADGTFKFEGSYISCGRMLMGIGSLLTGAKTFGELMSLAEAGDASNVDSTCRDYKDPESYDPYALLPDNAPIYCFGDAGGKSLSDFKREDVAAALISQFAQTQAHICHQAFLMTEAKTVMFAGSVCCESELMRDELTKHFLAALYMKPKETKTEVYYMKHGAYIGALGALLSQAATPPSQ